MKFWMNFLIILIFTSSISYSQIQPDSITINPEWKVGYKYSFKLTYNIKVNYDYSTDKEKSATSFIYQSLSVIDENEKYWITKLEFDHFDKNVEGLDSYITYRLFQNRIDYDLNIRKDTSDFELLNRKEIEQQYYDFLKLTLGERGSKEKLQSIINNEEMIGIPTTDYLFLYANNSKKFPTNKPIENTKTGEYWDLTSKQKCTLNKNKTLNYINILNIESHATQDTIEEVVKYIGPSSSTQDVTIIYDNKFIPTHYNRRFHNEFPKIKTSVLPKGFETSSDGGFLTENTMIELIDIKIID